MGECRKSYVGKVKGFWKEVAPEYDTFLKEMWEKDKISPSIEKKLKTFTKGIIEKYKPKSVLEIGDCSVVSPIVRKKVETFVCITLVPECLKRCEKFYDFLILGDVLEILPYLREEGFDFVLSIYGGFVFCRDILELSKYCKELERLLSDKGVILLDSPNSLYYGEKQVLRFKHKKLINKLLPINAMLEEIAKHFKILHIFGDHDMSAFSKNSRRFIVVGRKLKKHEKLILSVIEFLRGKETVESIKNDERSYVPTEEEKLLQQYSYYKINEILGKLPIIIEFSNALNPSKKGKLTIYDSKVKIKGYIYDSTLEDLKRFFGSHGMKLEVIK